MIVNNVSALIKNFLETFCTKVQETEEDSYVDLMMDDCDCIEYEDGNGITERYYVPQNNSLFTEDDKLLRNLIVNSFEL